jgi:hypothetical protein
MARERVAFLRFAVFKTHEGSLLPMGCFQAAGQLEDSGHLSPEDALRMREVCLWFNKHLETPTRFSRSTSKGSRNKARGISWFRHTAKEHISKMHELVMILEQYGWHVRRLVTERPGYVTYEDCNQIVAEPFKDTQI